MTGAGEIATPPDDSRCMRAVTVALQREHCPAYSIAESHVQPQNSATSRGPREADREEHRQHQHPRERRIGSRREQRDEAVEQGGADDHGSIPTATSYGLTSTRSRLPSR